MSDTGEYTFQFRYPESLTPDAAEAIAFDGQADDVAPLLDIRDLEVTYLGAVVGVHGVNVSVRPSEIAVLLGPNGAGKTTTINSVTGFTPVDKAQITRGSVWFEGRNVTSWSPERIARSGVSIIPERNKIFRSLTVEENLKCVITRKGESRTDLLAFVHELFPILKERRSQVSGYLSGGQVQMLAIARALLAGPKILLPDEISLGIAPLLVEQLMDALVKVNQEMGLAMLLVEQNASIALEIADTAHVLSAGTVVFSGTARELQSNSMVADLYTGSASR
jgi:branched-chain amino acid transport system ATP-binding protein